MMNCALLKKYLVLTGNYGSGKTELALNLALEAAKEEATRLVDLDIVNPYFTSAEKRDLLEKADVKLLTPAFAMTTVDIPALPPEIQSVFELPCDRVIFDVGGDDTGAAALGRYYPSFLMHRDETVSALVINCMRPLTQTREDILDLAQRIGNRGRLGIDLLINNTNLAEQTVPEMVERGEELVLSCAKELGIENVITSGIREILFQCRLRTMPLFIRRQMVPEWMEET